MNDDLFVARRAPLHAGAPQVDAGETSPKTNGLQQHAAVSTPADTDVSTPVQAQATAPEDYTISVEQVRQHFAKKGLPKSKDTIQRWCRSGDLDCQKRGVLNRYFTTETSLQALEQKLLPDAIAIKAGETPLRTAASTPANSRMQVHEPADAAVCSGTDLHAPESTPVSAAARSSKPLQTPATDAATKTTDGVEVAQLREKVAGLENQLKQAQEMNTFLQSEVVASRTQRGDVVEISKQMLETLQTIAVGGRLEPPQPTPSTDPVRMSHQELDHSYPRGGEGSGRV